MKNIILIGMMGCGKTTVGGLLARQLGRALVDTDSLIEEREGRPISAIFAKEGEPYFRARELDAARELAQGSALVIACGGGLPMQEEAIAALKGSGVVFWLNRDPGQTYDSLDTAGRPLAQGGREDFLSRYDRRAPIYRRWADHVISEGDSAAQVTQAITAILQSEEASA